jgi:hypothetical protein
MVTLEQRIRVVLPRDFVEEESIIKCKWPIKLDEAFVHMRKGRSLEDGAVLRYQAIAQSGPGEKVDCDRMCRSSLCETWAQPFWDLFELLCATVEVVLPCISPAYIMDLDTCNVP